MIALAGAGVEPGRNLKAQLRDVAPSILTWFGLPIPEHVEGEPLPCLSGYGWLGPNLRRDPGHELLNGTHQAGFEYTAEEQALIEQRLADLGYLE